MNSSDAIDVIGDIFRDAWIAYGLDAARIKWPNVPNEKPAGELSWARVIFQHVTGNQTSLRSADMSRRFSATGFVTCQIFTPIGDGSVASYSVGQHILDAFRIAQHSTIWFRNGRLIERPSGDEVFMQTNVIVDFSYDDVK